MPYADKEQQREFQRRWKKEQRRKHKAAVLALLGSRCSVCGNDDVRVLELDHIVPLKRNRTTNVAAGFNGTELWRRVAKGDIKDDEVQLLCANCHAIKTADDRRHFNPGGLAP